MLQPRIPKRLLISLSNPLSDLTSALTSLSLCPIHRRTLSTSPSLLASHAAQGRANGPGDSAGRRLGLKRGASEYVVPGNIIFKQRGTKWFPGENVGMGRDHTIYAVQPGYVRYYRDPARHSKRRYIGVALEKEGPRSMLPTPANAPTRRRLGMFAVPMKAEEAKEEVAGFLEAHIAKSSKPASVKEPISGGVYRMSNAELVKQAEKKQVRVRPFDKRDRFYAWRQRTKKFEAKKMLRASMGKGKKAKKARK